MTETTESTLDFNITVKDAGPARKLISVKVPSDSIDQEMNTTMGTLQSQAVLPGFRKGKAPSHLLKRRFGTAMQEETVQKLVREGLEKAVSDNKLLVLGNPEVVDGYENLKLEEGKPFEFALEIEIVPEFDFPDFSGIEIIRPALEVSDEHIDAEIERQCLTAGKADRLEDGFEPHDRMLGSVKITADGEDDALFVHDQALIVLPDAGEKGQVVGLLIDDMNAHFKSAKVGDTITISTTGPEAHEREDFRGKKITIEYTIHLCERVVPATQEELIERFNLGSEEVLREQIRFALEQRRDEEQAAVMRKQGLEKINELIDIELPERASGDQIQRELDRMRHEMMASGEHTPEEVEVKLAEIRSDAEVGMKQRMKNYFILQRLAMHFETQVHESEINARIAGMAMQRGLRPDHVRSELAKAGQLPAIGGQVRDDKAADAMVGQMKITDMPLDEWNAMHADGGTTTKKKTSKKAATKKAGTKKASTGLHEEGLHEEGLYQEGFYEEGLQQEVVDQEVI